ncbi:MAG: sigma-70 family RNA polymerase sigma factor [Verrucomicrobiota bacterium]
MIAVRSARSKRAEFSQRENYRHATHDISRRPRNVAATKRHLGESKSPFKTLQRHFRLCLQELHTIGSELRESWHGRCKTGWRMNQTISDDVNAVATNWVDAHGDYLFNFAIGQVRATDIAEDLLQETFLAAVRAQQKFSGRSSERTWLVGILRHKIYDHLRKTCRERAVRVDLSPASDDDAAFEDSLAWIHQMAAEATSPSRRLELAEFRQHLEKALGKLPARIAQVFQMYSIEERPNHEVCERLNISESNLWVMLHRARKQLRAELDSWWRGEPAVKQL